MRYLFLLVLVASLVGVSIIPNVLSNHDSDKILGTVFVDKPVLILPYSASDDSRYHVVKIFGTVEEPRSATWVHFTVTDPNGNISQITGIVSDNGNYETFIQICCNKVGEYSVYAEWKGYHIGTITFDVVGESPTITEDLEVSTQENIPKVPDWIRNIFIWYAEDKISEDELLNAIKFLVNQGIINLSE